MGSSWWPQRGPCLALPQRLTSEKLVWGRAVPLCRRIIDSWQLTCEPGPWEASPGLSQSTSHSCPPSPTIPFFYLPPLSLHCFHWVLTACLQLCFLWSLQTYKAFVPCLGGTLCQGAALTLPALAPHASHLQNLQCKQTSQNSITGLDGATFTSE